MKIKHLIELNFTRKLCKESTYFVFRASESQTLTLSPWVELVSHTPKGLLRGPRFDSAPGHFLHVISPITIWPFSTVLS